LSIKRLANACSVPAHPLSPPALLLYKQSMTTRPPSPPHGAPKLAFLASRAPAAQRALADMQRLYPSVALAKADILVALGGDGFLLRCLHQLMASTRAAPAAVFGMNLGSVGFLLNPYRKAGLYKRLQASRRSVLHPLLLRGRDARGRTHEARAINEVALIRQQAPAAKLRVYVDGRCRIPELIADGILLASPAGSTAYNLSAHGPILPLDSQLLALTPISAFRPRSWRGALLPANARLKLRVLEAAMRPVSVTADHARFSNMVELSIARDKACAFHLLFDPNHGLEERIISEQFLLR